MAAKKKASKGSKPATKAKAPAKAKMKGPKTTSLASLTEAWENSAQ